MKKLLAIIAAMLAIINVAYAYDFESGGIYYRITSQDDKTVEVTSGDTKYSGDVVIPETVTYSDVEYTVTTIGYSAFRDCSSLTSIGLPSSLTSISYYAFSNCSSLTSIELPSSLTSIGDWAFYWCRSLTSVELPSTLTSIGERSFYECGSLASIELPASLTMIGDFAFENCGSLTSIELPVSLTSIGKGAFMHCISLQNISVSEANENYTLVDGVLYDKKVSTLVWCPIGRSGEFTVPSSVTSIGDYAFTWCESLTSIELPSSLTEIGEGAFDECRSLTSIELPSSVTSIGDYAFYGCTTLTSINLPSSLIKIGNHTIQSCNSLMNIELPSSVTSIGEYAFDDCTSLASIELPSSVSSIGNGAFQSCTSLKKATSLNPEPPSLGSDVFYGCPILAIFVPTEAISTYQAAEGWNDFNILDVKYKDSPTSFEVDGICYNVTSITNKIVEVAQRDGNYSGDIVIPEIVSYSDIEYKVTQIGNFAFYRCSSLTSIKLPASVTLIGDYVFVCCSSLTSIELPSSVTSIGDYAFAWCYSLKTVTCLNLEPPTLGSYVFNSSPIESVFVPTEAISAYQAAEGWKDFNIVDAAYKDLATEFEVDGIYYHVTSFADKTVEVTSGDNDYTGEISIPETVTYSDTEYTVTTIGDYAFVWCGSLKNIELPISLSSINNYAFQGCYSLTSIELPPSVTEIGGHAFEYCWSLKTVTCLNPEPPTLEENAFNECPIETVYVPSGSVETYQAADGWKEFNIVDMASRTDFEVDGIYYNITSFTDKTVEVIRKDYSGNIVIPNIVSYLDIDYTVTSIGDNAFLNCYSLESLKLPSSVTSIGRSAFQDCMSMTDIDLSTSLTSIGDYAFAHCYSINGIKLPSSVTSIGRCAFQDCTSMTDIDLSTSLTSIGDYAFYHCSSLNRIEFPLSLTEIGYATFAYCHSLQEISVSDANENYTSVDGVLYDKKLSTLISYPGGKSSEFIIPSSVTSIGNAAFYGCIFVSDIEIPSTVISIEYDAFFNCNSLTSIKIPSSVKEIYDYAFAYCYSLKAVTSLNIVPPTLYSGVFEDSPIETVYVPTEAVSAYQSAEGWSEFNIVGMSNVGDEEVPVYVVSDIVEEEGTVQEAREEVSFDFVEYSEVATGQGTATLTREGSSEVVNLPAAQIAGEATQARALRVVAADGKDYQVVQPLGNAATAAGNYTIHFPEGYFLLGTQKEDSPAFTMSFTVGDVSGITDAIINSADAEYYTLQGVKVQGKPAPGIYICRQGNKATKVVVK